MSAINRKDEKVRKLWERGVRDLPTIAKKLGYSGGAVQKGIERVQEALVRLKLQ